MKKTHLYSTNAQVSDHKNAMYQAAHTQRAQIKCIDIVVGDMSTYKTKSKKKFQMIPLKLWAYIMFQLLWEQNMT